jgi:conjugal transfer pilus assembly protein TraV
MKPSQVISPLLLLFVITGCSVINPYEENFRCRTRDDAGKCIDTPSAYNEARNPRDLSTATCVNSKGEAVPCPGVQRDTSNCVNQNGDSIPCSSNDSIKVVVQPLQVHPNKLSAQNSRYKALAELLDEPDKPMLEPPKVMRVLLLPYKGEGDELFMTRFVYLKLKDSQWVLTDIREKATRGRK